MFLADNYVLSEMLYKAVLVREPNHLSAMLELAIVYEATGRLQYARGLLTRASIQKPYDQQIIDRNNDVAKRMSRSLETEIDSLLSAGAFDMALPKLSVLLTTQPENAELYFEKARCHLKLGNPEAALSEIEKAVKLQKDDRFHALRIEALTLKNNKEIRTLSREVRRLMPAHRPEDRDRALALISQILARDPEHGWAKRQFVALTGGRNDGAQPERTESRWTGVRTAIVSETRRAVGIAASVGDVLNRHLDVLLFVLVALIIFSSPLTFMIIRGFSPRQSLSGRFNQFNIHEVLSMIHSQNRTGVLRIHAGSAKGRLYFNDGEIYHCTGGGLEGRDAIRHLIENAKDGHFVFTRSTGTSRKTVDAPISLILMDLPERRQSIEKAPPKTGGPVHPPKKSRMKALLENKV